MAFPDNLPTLPPHCCNLKFIRPIPRSSMVQTTSRSPTGNSLCAPCKRLGGHPSYQPIMIETKQSYEEFPPKDQSFQVLRRRDVACNVFTLRTPSRNLRYDFNGYRSSVDLRFNQGEGRRKLSRQGFRAHLKLDLRDTSMRLE